MTKTKNYEMICNKLSTVITSKNVYEKEVFSRSILSTSILSVFTWDLYFLCHFSRLINKYRISASSKN